MVGIGERDEKRRAVYFFFVVEDEAVILWFEMNIFPDDIPLPTIEIPATLKLELPNMHG